MIDKLLKIFGNYTRSLEILYLLNDIKKLVRLDANEVELKNIKDFCNKENLHLEISDFKVIKIMDKGKGSYANVAKKVPINYPGSGLYHIYISKDKNKAKFLKLLEYKNDDKAVGELLDYPQCCVDFFMENKEKQQKIQNDFILLALNNSEGFKFSFYINYAIRYFDITLLSHFPHSFNCQKSIEIAKINFECIKKYSNELVNKFETMLKGPVLYTENNGVFMFKDYKLNNNILEFNEINSTINNDLLELLNENKKFEIVDKNRIKLKNEIIEDVGFMLFN
ncbi:MAG: DUF483 domain-containing protein [Nanoarchaeota archaeon]|nr:DUF483 domain-containing protein [Nanoarchaeota archaeon]